MFGLNLLLFFSYVNLGNLPTNWNLSNVTGHLAGYLYKYDYDSQINRLAFILDQMN
jgi:hypothetical protein